VLVYIIDDEWWRFDGAVVDLLKSLSVGFGEGAHVRCFCRVKTLTMILEDANSAPVLIVILFFSFGFFV
jgi:hypothetical protein